MLAPELEQQVIVLLAQGRKVDAVRLLRGRARMGALEARRVVDELTCRQAGASRPLPATAEQPASPATEPSAEKVPSLAEAEQLTVDADSEPEESDWVFDDELPASPQTGGISLAPAATAAEAEVADSDLPPETVTVTGADGAAEELLDAEPASRRTSTPGTPGTRRRGRRVALAGGALVLAGAAIAGAIYDGRFVRWAASLMEREVSLADGVPRGLPDGAAPEVPPAPLSAVEETAHSEPEAPLPLPGFSQSGEGPAAGTPQRITPATAAIPAALPVTLLPAEAEPPALSAESETTVEPEVPTEEGQGFRLWTDDRGRRAEARLVEVSDGVAILESRAGKRFPIPLDRLSPADREFLTGRREP